MKIIQSKIDEIFCSNRTALARLVQCGVTAAKGESAVRNLALAQLLARRYSASAIAPMGPPKTPSRVMRWFGLQKPKA